MYQFSRRVQLSKSNASAQEWVTNITEKVVQTTGWQVGVWSRVFSSDVGTVVWSMFAPDLATLETGFDKLLVDNGYTDLVDQGQQHIIVGSVHDSLYAIIHPSELTLPEHPITYVSVVDTTMNPGQLATGIALGVEIAERVQQLGGAATLFAAASTGNYGGVRWMTGFADVQEMERAEGAVNGDPGFIELIDSKASKAYTATPGAATQAIFRRII